MKFLRHMLSNRLLHIFVALSISMFFLSGVSALIIGVQLDPSFGTAGVVTTDIGDVWDVSMVLQPDGKIVVSDGTGIARYTVTGTLDSSFGTQGIALTQVGRIARQPDGKFVSVLTWPTVLYASAILLMRHTITGTVDTEFGTNGVVTTVVGSSSSAGAIAVQPDGKIVVVGGVGYKESKILMVRYNSNGSLDANFGISGTLVIDLGRYDYATSLALQPDGKIIVAGNSSERMFVARCTMSGTLDTTFNSTGVVTTSLPGKYPSIGGVALQSGGKVVVAGVDDTNGNATNILLARYTMAGILDTSFGVGGIVVTSVDSGTGASSLIVQPDDRIVIGGASYSNDAHRRNFMAARYFPAGELDITFGSSGVVTSSIGLSYSAGRSVAVQPDGKVVLAGYSSDDGLKNNLTVARYLSSAFPNTVYLPLIQK